MIWELGPYKINGVKLVPDHRLAKNELHSRSRSRLLPPGKVIQPILDFINTEPSPFATLRVGSGVMDRFLVELDPDLRQDPPSAAPLPTRYHAALNEVEAHARTTARSILELLREFEKATGAEVAEVKLDRAYAYGVPPELKIVDLKLNPMPAARVRAGKEKG